MHPTTILQTNSRMKESNADKSASFLVSVARTYKPASMRTKRRKKNKHQLYNRLPSTCSKVITTIQRIKRSPRKGSSCSNVAKGRNTQSKETNKIQRRKHQKSSNTFKRQKPCFYRWSSLRWSHWSLSSLASEALPRQRGPSGGSKTGWPPKHGVLLLLLYSNSKRTTFFLVWGGCSTPKTTRSYYITFYL